jgi:TonB family protein
VPPDSVNLLATKIIKPIYPIAADKDKLEGQVVVKAAISETGDVESVEVMSGDPTLAQAATDAAKEWKFKPFIRNGKPAKVSTKLAFTFVFLEKVPDERPTASAAVSQETPPTLSLTTVRASLDGNHTMLVKRVEPDYPEIAKAARIQGTVMIFAVIGKEGTITVLHLISGHPLLAPAALQAVKQWRYRPFVLNGQPVEVQTTITVRFFLRG